MNGKLASLLLLAVLALPLAAESVSGGLLQVQALKYEPYPAEPGSYTDLWLSVANSKSSVTADNVECLFTEGYPFSLDSSEPALKVIGQLRPGYDAIIKYKVRISENAVPGNNEFTVSCTSTGYPAVELKDYIYVQPHDAVLSVASVNSVVMLPGETALVELTLQNLEDVTVKDVSVKLDLESTSTKFAPVGSTGEKRLKQIPANGEETVTFTVIAYPDATPGVYKIPLELAYSDWLGTAYAKSEVVTITVDAPAKLEARLESSEVYKNAALGQVTIEIVNRGLSDVKFLSVRLLPATGYTVTSASEAYVGELASDDSTSVDYDLYVNSTSSTALLVELSYTNAFNREVTETQNVVLPVYSQAEITALGLEPTAQIGLGVLLVGGAVILYLAYHAYGRFKKK
ncbi:MAG: hypothetical protein WC607_00410 [Candidatus Micrarchaeia archaeon]